MSTIELLAPVGHREGLLAAVTNGADAIYVGGAAFGARKEAAFTNEELIEVIKFSHLHQVKVYVTVNTTIFDQELEALKEYIHFLYLNDVDAIIVQDIGVAHLVKQMYPDFELHFSTQMTLHNTKGTEFAKKFGADRIVVARENTLEEIKAMKQAVDIDLEVFVHGALCVCYSGQCLMSSMIGARSGNRGACAQTCRLPYELVDLSTGKTLDSQIGDFLLSPKDLKTIDEIGELIEAGVTSFKIEGRLKKPEYVATVVKAYREAIDQYMQTRRIKISKQTHMDMDQIFSRGFTKGYLFGDKGLNLMSTDRPNHKGILIGEVFAVKGKRATIQLKSSLEVGDGLRFVALNSKDQGLQVQKMFIKGKDVKLAQSGFVELDIPFSVSKGMKVYKTTSVSLAKRVEVTEKSVPKIDIYGEVSAKLGEPLKIMAWDNDSNMVTVETKEVFETATNTPLTQDRLKQQLQKTGSTPFTFAYINLNMDEGITMPISSINKIRRELLEQLEQIRVHHHKDRHRTENKPSLSNLETNAVTPQLTVSVRNIKQLQIVLKHEIETIYYKDIKTLKKAVELGQAHGITVIPQLPRIISDGEIQQATQIIESLPIQKVMLGEYGMYHALENKGYILLTDFAFNTNNVQSIEALKQLGISQITLSYEINQKQIRGLLKQAPLPSEMVVYTRIPMMIMKHCPVKLLNQEEFCRMCLKTPFGLRDRKNKILPLLRTGNCITEIFNSQHLLLIEFLSELQQMGIQSFRLEFTNEDETAMNEAIIAYQSALQTGQVKTDWLAQYKNSDDYTKGHYHRGVQ
ncbi:MAG: DUF3656 domain-containing protein [Turicibacter sp.]|nr:DUF3656 domain-containing protein [Turicibacter sp.]